MKITDKTKLLRTLITATTKEVILEFTNCYLNIYCLGNTYFTKVETIQVATDNKFTGYLVVDKNSELINLIKDCCTKKSSELEFKVDLNNNNYLYFKRTSKDELAVVDINVLTVKPETLTLYLDTINKQEFINEKLLTYNEYSKKIETKFEYEVVEINNNVLISSVDLQLIPKVFDVEFNKLVTLKPELNIEGLKKKDIEAIKSNSENVIVTYEDLVISNSTDLIQITNIEQDIYFYCKRCFKL